MRKILKRNAAEIGYLFLAIFVILLPVIQAAGILLYYHFTKGFAKPYPMWNDEAVYYALVKTFSTPGAHGFFGMPRGYYGFNGNHALLGTGSAWNPAVLLPYAGMALVFGLKPYSLFFFNLFFLCAGTTIALFIVKPSKKTLLFWMLFELINVPVILYSTTSMSEPLRFAFTFILAAMIVRLFDYRNHSFDKILNYVILPVYIVFLCQVYIFFVFVIPVYAFGIMKDKKIWKKVLVSLASLVVVGGGSYVLLHFISSNYNIYKTEGLMAALSRGDVIGAIRSFIGMFVTGVKDVFSLTLGNSASGMLRWYIPFLVGLLFILLFYGISGWKYNHLDSALCIAGAGAGVLFLGGFVTMYSPDPFTFFRSTAIVMIFGMIMLLNMKKKMPAILALILLLPGMFFVPANLNTYNGERFIDVKERQEWKSMEDTFRDILPDSAVVANGGSDVPWEYTVCLFTLEPRVIAAIPSGYGINMMLQPGTIPEEAGYVVLTKKTQDFRSDWLEMDPEEVKQNNPALFDGETFFPIYEDMDTILLKRREQ